MSGPLILPGATVLPAEIRWYDVFRNLYLLAATVAFGVLVLVAIATDWLGTWRYVLGPAAALAAVLVVRLGYFRWLNLKMLARESIAEPGQFPVLFACAQVPAGEDKRTRLVGPGWLLVAPDGLEIMEVSSIYSRRQDARRILRISSSEVLACSDKEVARGHGYRRLTIEMAEGRALDVAVTNQSGRSFAGPRDREVTALAARIRLTLQLEST